MYTVTRGGRAVEYHDLSSPR